MFYYKSRLYSQSWGAQFSAGDHPSAGQVLRLLPSFAVPFLQWPGVLPLPSLLTAAAVHLVWYGRQDLALFPVQQTFVKGPPPNADLKFIKFVPLSFYTQQKKQTISYLSKREQKLLFVFYPSFKHSNWHFSSALLDYCSFLFSKCQTNLKYKHKKDFEKGLKLYNHLV